MARTPRPRAPGRDAAGAPVDPQLRAELRRLAGLFLVSSITLALFILRAVYVALDVALLPDAVVVVWSVALIAGWATTFAYGLYVILKARRWLWAVLFAIPLTCVPAGVAYSWTRRMDIERQVLDGRTASGPPSKTARRR